MNGNEPKIEIFAPFGVAYEWMKTILFRPFDLSKWLVIAFAAFIGGTWGNGFNFNVGDWKNSDWKYRWSSHGNLADGGLPAWVVPLGIVVALLVFLVVIAVMWVTSRGQFIFTDCVVKNRAAIAEPWREYRREGNSYFLFSLALAFLGMVVFGVLVLIIALPFGLFSTKTAAAGLEAPVIISIALVALVSFAFVLFFALISNFMVPVMYRRRCLAKDAFFDVVRLILRSPGPFVLFVLFGIVLMIAVGIIGTLVMCMTCCIGGLPYISTVLLLPAHVWLRTFKLLFVRQFGDQYDVWATVAVPDASSPPPAPPPDPILPPPPTASA